MKRKRFALLPLLPIPALAVWGHSGAYALSGLLITALILFSAALTFETRDMAARRLCAVAALTALSVLGRFLFAVFPGFKPVTAVTALAAFFLGGEAGFAVGAFSALLSNLYFGQGPWTPFQMLAWGLCGLLAGWLAKPLRQSRILLILYALFAGALFSFCMDSWTVLWAAEGFEVSLYLAALTASLPMIALYGVSNAVFLLVLTPLLGKKLDRMKQKYGF